MKEKDEKNIVDLPNKPGSKAQTLDVKPQSVVKLIEEFTITNMNDFFDIISKFNRAGFVFFRGDKIVDSFKLVPSIYKPKYENLIDKEDEIIDEFVSLAISKNTNYSENYLEDMLNAQHYEIPTRLQDWTESALIALYFSVYPHKDDSIETNSVIWALNPLELNSNVDESLRKSQKIPHIFSNRIEGEISDIRKKYEGEKWVCNPTPYPIALKTRKINPRIEAQRGVFVLFPKVDYKKSTALTDYQNSGTFLKKIIIPNDKKSFLFSYLIDAGMSQYMLFPEMKSIAEDIIKKYSSIGGNV